MGSSLTSTGGVKYLPFLLITTTFMKELIVYIQHISTYMLGIILCEKQRRIK